MQLRFELSADKVVRGQKKTWAVCRATEPYLQDLDITWREPSPVSIPLSLPPASGQSLDHFNNVPGLEAQSLLVLLPAERVQTFAVRPRHRRSAQLLGQAVVMVGPLLGGKKGTFRVKSGVFLSAVSAAARGAQKRSETCVKLLSRFSSSCCQDAPLRSAPPACLPASKHRVRLQDLRQAARRRTEVNRNKYEFDFKIKAQSDRLSCRLS